MLHTDTSFKKLLYLTGRARRPNCRAQQHCGWLIRHRLFSKFINFSALLLISAVNFLWFS